jgi:predicted glycosyl hydrolase (DUF1957 family)
MVQEGQIKKAMNHTHSNAALKSHNHAGRYALETGFQKLENKVESINEAANNHAGSLVRLTPNDHHRNLLRRANAGELYAGKKMEGNVAELANALAALNQKVSQVSSQVPDEMDRVVLTFDMSGFGPDLLEDVIKRIQEHVSSNSFVRYSINGWAGGFNNKMSEIGVDWSVGSWGEGGLIRFWNEMPLPNNAMATDTLSRGGRFDNEGNTAAHLRIGIGTDNYVYLDGSANLDRPNHQPPQSVVTSDKFGFTTVEHKYFVNTVYMGGERYNASRS